jgi:hypothetical protein
VNLKTDLFASPGNKKLDQFVSRWAHWEAVAVDALQCPLDNLGDLYANPPWSVIDKFLTRLKTFPNVKILMVLPYWDSAIWWPQLIKMKVPKTPCLRVTPYKGMFKNCWGRKCPPQMGPPLHHLLRKILEGRQIQNSTIEDFIGKHPSLKRYESSFHLLWEILEKTGVPPYCYFGPNCSSNHSIVSILNSTGQKCIQCHSHFAWI